MEARIDDGQIASWPEWLGAATIVLSPFYVFHPGNPQPTDFVLVLMLCLPCIVTRYSMPLAIARPVYALAAFVIYVLLCNTTWAVVTGELDFFKASAFYAFNAFVFLGFLVMLGRRGDRWVRWTLYGFMATIVLLTVLSVPFSDRAESGRLELFFNNANQLAYHVLLSASIVTMLAPRYRISRLTIYFLLACCVYLELRTYSRAGLLGTLLLGALLVVERQTLLTLIALPLLALALYWDLQSLDTELWQNRLQTVHGATTDAYMTDRGLDRIFDYPEYLLLGAGEGLMIRFDHLKTEIHSSAANLVFSYGVPGTILFLVFLGWILRTAGARMFLLMVPALAYSLFHHGMRARPFWILLALALGVSMLAAVEATRKRQVGPGPKITGGDLARRQEA